MASGRYRHSGERVSPEFPDAQFDQHVRLYECAGQLVNGKTVLDLGCGTGYGTHALSVRGAKAVYGVDSETDAVAYSKRKYAGESVQFREMDALDITYPNDSFDVVVCIEVLQQLTDPDKSLAQIRRVLKRGGVLFLTAPNKEILSPASEGTSCKYHVHEFTFEELEEALKKQFRSVLIIESPTESESYVGRKMKEERRRKGKIGLEPGTKPLQVGKLKVDLSGLADIRSFVVFAW
ncbi:MAG TPA: class I SAM-dependent methyltransferase [Bacteroidota bacterium]|nr:class I SAM-dependent methyltransferase [Bacteroidota bacterium]